MTQRQDHFLIILQDDETDQNFKIRLPIAKNVLGRELESAILQHVQHSKETSVSEKQIGEHETPSSTTEMPSETTLTNNSSSTSTIEVYCSQQERFQPLSEVNHVLNELNTTLLRCCIVTRTTTTTDKREELLRLPGRYFAYNPSTGIEIAGMTFRVDDRPNEKGAGTGFSIWDGALLLSRYLEKVPSMVQGKHIIELGSGCGLVGIVASALGASFVLLTDLPYTMDLLRHNISKHGTLINNQRIGCCVYDWTCRDLPLQVLAKAKNNGHAHFDLILLADCIWLPQLVQPLLNTLSNLATSSNCQCTKVLISYQRRGKTTHNIFWKGLGSICQSVQQINLANVGIEAPSNLGLYLCVLAGCRNENK